MTKGRPATYLGPYKVVRIIEYLGDAQPEMESAEGGDKRRIIVDERRMKERYEELNSRTQLTRKESIELDDLRYFYESERSYGSLEHDCMNQIYSDRRSAAKRCAALNKQYTEDQQINELVPEEVRNKLKDFFKRNR